MGHRRRQSEWNERIESGLLSYGGDADGDTNPFEVRLEKYVNLDLGADVIGINALKKLKEKYFPAIGRNAGYTGMLEILRTAISSAFSKCCPNVERAYTTIIR